MPVPSPVLRKPPRALALGAALALLGGCTAGPTEAELTAAIRAEMDRANALAASMLGPEAAARTATRIHGLDKLGCVKEEGGDAYVCGIEVDITAPPAQRRKLASRVRMAKQDNGWTVVKTF